MVSNILKVVLRFLFRSRFFTILNLTGLSIALACTIVIFLFVHHELSYDRFHHEGSSIYRVVRQSAMNGLPYNIGITSAPFADALKHDFGHHIKNTTRAFAFSSLVQFKDKTFIEEKMLLADKNFFGFFSFPLAKGNPLSVLLKPNDIVVSSEFATKYFGEEDPVGQIIRVDDQYDLTVSGVLDDLPGNTHLQFDAVGSLDLIMHEAWVHEWWNNSMNTYVQVENPSSVPYLNNSFPAFMDKYFGKDFERIGNRINLTLEPLHEIYFNQDTRYERNIAHGNKRYIFIFGTVGVILILLAAINYTNLATAQSVQRAKEVGIRKTLGSQRVNIALQFIGESFLLCVLAASIALSAVQVIIPFINNHLNLSIRGIFTLKELWYFLSALVFVLSLLAGAYPAFVLSSFSAIKVMKGPLKSDTRFLFIRKGLITLQYTISATMITASLYIGSQLDFMHGKDLGFEQDHVLVLRLNNDVIRENREALMERLTRQKDVISVSSASGNPGGYHDATTIDVEGQKERIRMRTLFADENFVHGLGISLAHGRFFSKDIPSDVTSAAILNETAVKEMGWTNEQAIGKRVQLTMFDSVHREVVGVVKDFHFESLKETIEPLVISCQRNNNTVLIKIAGGDTQHAIQSIEEIWDSYDTGFPMELVFLNEVLQQLYTSENTQGRIFSILSMISITIACLGIFGLASFYSIQRRKEIGIRKVVGASTKEISLMLIKDLMILVLIANIIAIPIGYYGLQKWSEGFAYRAPIGSGIFVAGVLTVLAIAFLIVGLNAVKAAWENPVKALRSE